MADDALEAISLDETSQAIISLVDAACQEAPLNLACPACGETLPSSAPNFEVLASHLAASHALAIREVTSLPFITEYVAAVIRLPHTIQQRIS